MSNHARPANWIILLDGILLLLLGIVLVGTSLQEEAWVVQLGGGLLVLAGLGVGAKLWMTPGHEKVSPVAWIVESAGIDWMRHPAMYDPAGTADIGPELRSGRRSWLAAVVLLVVGCLSSLAAKPRAAEESEA